MLRLQLAPWTCLLFSFLSNLSIRLVQVPLLQICELGVCRRYYVVHDPSVIDSNGNVEEEFCKSVSVQERVALIMGLLDICFTICGLILAIPYGFLSDQIGRRPFLFCSAISWICTSAWIIVVGYFYNVFPVESLLVLPAFFLVSGGEGVAIANMYAIIADCAVDEVQRTTFLGYLNATSQALLLLGPVISSSSMSINIWAPLWISIAVSSVAAFTVVALLPETRRCTQKQSIKQHPSPGSSATQPLLPRASDDSIRLTVGRPTHGIADVMSKVRQKLYTELQDIKSLFQASKNFRFCLFVLLMASLGSSSMQILLQFISLRYKWTYVQAGYLLSVKAAVLLLLYLFIIPVGMRMCTERRNISKSGANIIAAKISIITLCLGALAITVSITIRMFVAALIVLVLGFGLPLFIMSLLGLPELGGGDQQHNARTYSIVTMIEAVGFLSGVPILTVTWAGGIQLGGVWLGSPFLLCSLSYLAASFAMWNIKI